MDGAEWTHQESIGLPYQEHRPWLYRWLCKKMSCRLDVADITQDTFVRMLLKDGVAIAEPRA